MIDDPLTGEDPFARPPAGDEALQVAGRWDLIKPAIKSFWSGKRAKELREEGEEMLSKPPAASEDEMEALRETLGEQPPLDEAVREGMAREAQQQFGEPGTVNVYESIPDSTPEHIRSMADRVFQGQRTDTRNLNFDYLESTDAAKALINSVAEEAEGFVTQRRGVRSQATTRRASRSAQVTQEVAELIGGQPGQAWNAEQLVAGRQIMLRLAEDVQTLSKEIAVSGGSPEDKARLVRMHKSLVAMQRGLQGGIAEAGRALNSMQMIADPAYPKERMAQLDQIIRTSGGNKNVEDLANMYSQAGTPQEITETARTLSSYWDRGIRTVQEIWINSILSGVATHVVNAMGNTIVQMYETGVIKPTAAMVGAARSMVSDVPSMSIAEIPPEVVGKTQGVIDTFHAMWRDKMDYIRNLDEEQKLENPKFRAISAENYGMTAGTPSAAAIDKIGGVIRIPGTMLSISDDMFKSMVYRGEINAQAARIAIREGLTGGAMQERAYDLMQNPTADMHIAAKAEADKLTFTADLADQTGFIAWFGRMIQEGNEKYPVLKFFTPFVRTPANIANYMLQNSMLAPMTRQWRDDLAAGGIRADKAVARLGVALATTWGVWQMSENGRVTGNGPKDYKLRSQLERTGWQPNSILIGDTYYAYDRMDPIGGMFGFIADAADLVRYSEDAEESQNIASAVIGGVLQNFSSKTYMQGFNELVGMLNGGPRVDNQVQKMVKSWAGGLVPFSGLLRTFRKGEDEIVRDARNRNDFLQSLMNTYANGIPGYSDALPARLDWKGDVHVMQGNVLWRSMSPIRQSALKGDKPSLELVNNGVVVSEPSYIISFPGGIKFNLLEVDPTGHLYNEYKRLVGESRYEMVKKALTKLNRNKETRASGVDTPRSDVLSKAIMLGRKAGLGEFLKYYRREQHNNPDWPKFSKSTIKAAIEWNKELVESGKPQEGAFTSTKIGQGGLIPEQTVERLQGPRF